MRHKLQQYLYVLFPKFLELHHIDLNTRNNDLFNLIILDRKTHKKIHGMIRKGCELANRKELHAFLRRNKITRHFLMPDKKRFKEYTKSEKTYL